VYGQLINEFCMLCVLAPSTESSESTETADQNDESSVSSQNTTSSFTISFADGDPVLASVTPCKPFSDINLSQQKASDDIDMEANKRKKISKLHNILYCQF